MASKGLIMEKPVISSSLATTEALRQLQPECLRWINGLLMENVRKPDLRWLTPQKKRGLPVILLQKKWIPVAVSTLPFLYCYTHAYCGGLAFGVYLACTQTTLAGSLSHPFHRRSILWKLGEASARNEQRSVSVVKIFCQGISLPF